MAQLAKYSLLLMWLLASTSLSAMSLDQAVAKAEATGGGQVISARTQMQEGRSVHIVRVLGKDGRVRRLRYPADDDR